MLIGSKYFFKDIEGFSSKDIDYLELIENPSSFNISYQLSGKGKCIFKWKKMSAKEFIQISLHTEMVKQFGLVRLLTTQVKFSIFIE